MVTFEAIDCPLSHVVSAEIVLAPPLPPPLAAPELLPPPLLALPLELPPPPLLLLLPPLPEPPLLPPELELTCTPPSGTGPADEQPRHGNARAMAASPTDAFSD
jgi:hypothetical protein